MSTSRRRPAMPHEPAASIVIPAYNAERTLGRAVRSALAQTAPVEVIIVDDASSDGTVDVARALARGDGRIAILRQNSNQGPGAARNAGIAVARGRFIALLDADDAYAPNRIAVLTEAAIGRDSDLVCDNLKLVPEDPATELPARVGGPLAFPEPWLTSGPVSLRDLLIRDQGHHGSRWEFGFAKPIISRGFLERTGVAYDPSLRLGEDFLFYADCLLAGARFDAVPDALYEYTVATGTLRDNHRGYLVLADINARLRERIGTSDAALRALVEQRQSFIEYAALRRAVMSLDVELAMRLGRSIPMPYLAHRLARIASLKTLRWPGPRADQPTNGHP